MRKLADLLSDELRPYQLDACMLHVVLDTVSKVLVAQLQLFSLQWLHTGIDF